MKLQNAAHVANLALLALSQHQLELGCVLRSSHDPGVSRRQQLPVVQHTRNQLGEPWIARVYHVVDRVGYRDKLNVPKALALARKLGLLERNLDLEHASYFVSRIAIKPTGAPGMRRWRKGCRRLSRRGRARAFPGGLAREHFGVGLLRQRGDRFREYSG